MTIEEDVSLDNLTRFVMAVKNDCMERDPFFLDDHYKWWLGARVAEMLGGLSKGEYVLIKKSKIPLLLGISVEIDTENPWRCELWHNVTLGG